MASASVVVEAFEPERRAPPAPTTPPDVVQAATEADLDLLFELRKHVLLTATLTATVTLSAGGLNPPGGFWSGDDGALLAGDLLFFYSSSTAFTASLVVILVLLLGNLFTGERIKHRALQSALVLDLFGLAGAYAARVNLSVLLVLVSLYTGIHVMVSMSKAFPSYATWRKALREKIGQSVCVPGWLKKLFEHAEDEEEHAEEEEAAATMKRKLEKRRRNLLLLLAILATSLTYHDGLGAPCDDVDQVHYLAFIYGNAAAFVGSVAVTMLLLDRKLSTRGTRGYALSVYLILDMLGLTAAFAAGSYRKKTSMIDVFVLVSAILVCVAFQVTLSVSETVRGLVQWLGWPRLPLGDDEEEGSEDDELELGVAGGTDGEPLRVEISSPILGGALTLVLAVPVMAFLANPVKLLVAVMVASIGVSIWRSSLAPPLRALARVLQRRRVTPPAGSNANVREHLMPALCRALGELIHKLCRGTWLWSVLVVVWVPALRPNLKLKLKMSSISAVLGVSTPAPATATVTGTSTMATDTVDAPSTATSGVTTDDAPTAAAAAVTTTTPRARMGRRLQPLVETRLRRNRRANTRLG